MRRLCTALVAVALAACGSTATDGDLASTESPDLGIDAPSALPELADGSTTPGAPADDAAPLRAIAPSAARAAVVDLDAPGVDTDDSPISVGILYTNNDAAPSAGVDNGNTYTLRTAFEGYVAAYNDRGGIGGRLIEPIYVEVRSSSVALEADLQAACSTFTQDNDVALVLSSVGLFSEPFTACLADAGTPQVAGDYALGDGESLAEAPSFYAPDTLTIDDRMRALLDRGSAARRLTADDRLGVVVEGCPFNLRAYDEAVVPTARRLGLTIADRVDASCFEGANDLGSFASEMASAVLRFRSAGVTKVVFVSGSVEGNLMLFFAAAAESQRYRPGYALTSVVVPAVQETNTPTAQLANAFGLGWIPSLDSSRPTRTGPAAEQCTADLEAGAGVTPTSPADRFYAFSVCDGFRFADAALRRSRGFTDVDAVAAAASGIGGGLAAAAVHGEATDYGGGRRTGPVEGRLFAWSGPCGCFEYVGSPFRLAAG